MKILWNNYLSDSTVTATSEDSLYPVSSLYRKFLDKKFQAIGSLTTVTVLFPEDRTVSMLAYGFNNVTTSENTIVLTKGAADTIVLTKGSADSIVLTLSASYVLKDSSGSTLLTGVLEVGDDVNINYLDPAVSCRSVEITFASSGENPVYVGGLSIGDPLVYDYTVPNQQLINQLRSDVSQTSGGQVIGNQDPMLREWRVSIPSMTNTKRLETQAMLRAVGQFQPVFADLWEDSDQEEPMYGHFTQAGTYRRDSRAQDYRQGLTLKEAR